MDYLIEIVARLRDEAADGIRNLKREVDQLKASAAAGDVTGDLRQGLADTADEAERATQAHKDLNRQQQETSRVARQSESDVRRTADQHERAARSVAGHAASHEDLAGNVGGTSQEIDNFAKKLSGAEDAMKRVQQGESALGGETKKLQERVDDALESFDELSKTWEHGSGDLKQLRQDLTASGRELDGLSKRFQTFSKDAQALRDAAEQARSMAKSLGTLQEESRQPVLNSLDEELRKQKERIAAEQEVARVVKQLNLETEKARRDTSKRLADAEIEDAHRVAAARRQSRSIEQAVGSAARPAYTLANPAASQTQELRAARDLEQARARLIRSGLSPEQAGESIGRVRSQALSDYGFGTQAERDVAQIARAQTQARQMAARMAPKPERDFTAEGNALIQKMRALDQAARSHTASNAELTAGYSKLASGLRRVWGEMETGSTEARKFGDAMEEAGKKAKNLDLARSSSGLGRFAQQVAEATDSIGIKIISLSAALRGARLAGLVGLFQPIVTGLMSLAGGFFSVASGAGQAAATIGGVFLSGLGQLIPMVSVGIAALIRLRDVFQAVQAAQAARQESFFQPFQGLITQLQNASQLIQSEQALANAYYTLQDAQVQVKESQMALTQARIDAIRNLQDLVLAEKSAQLQLRNANLSVVQAEQQLQAAQASGSQMAIQQAQLQLQGARLSQQQATLAVPRSRQNLALAQGYGVAGSPEVLAATEAHRQSLLGVVQAQQQIGNAQRQMRITQLQMRQPASYMTQQQSTLAYLMSQMSGPEKALFGVINNLEKQLRSPNSPLKKISDDLINPFLYAFQRLDTLLNDPSFLGPINRLAQTMGAAVQSIFHEMFGPRGTTFFEVMANDATKSIPIVTRAITGLMRVFEDLAKAAAPAFNRLSRDWANFWNELDARDRTPQGQARLAKFFNQGAKWAEDFGKLAVAVYDLFKALGHDAAPQGMQTVTSLTEAIHDATTWVQTHGPEVTRFFSQARQGMALLGGILFQIGKQLLQVFSLTSLQAFSQLLTTVVLPAARMLATALGFLVTKFTQLLNKIGPLKDIVVGLATAFLGLLVLNRFISAVTKATNVLGGFSDAMKAFRNGEGIINRITSAWEALTGRISKGTKAMNEAKTAQEGLTGAETAGAGAASAEAAAQTELDAAELAAGGAGAAGAAGTAGVTAEEALAGGGTAGLLARFGGGAGLARLGLFGALAYTGYKGFKSQNLLGSSATGGKGTQGDLAALLGKIGGSHYSWNAGDIANSFNPFGGSFLHDKVVGDQSTSTTRLLQSLQSGLTGITDPTQLSTNQLQRLYQQANQLLQLPDITAKQRQGLSQLIQVLNPTTVATQKLADTWSATFQGINATTSSVMQQVQQILSQDIQSISDNLGTGTKQGAAALDATFASAMDSIMSNTTAAVRNTKGGMKQLNQIVNDALKAMGEPPIDFTGVSSSPGAGGASLSTLKGLSAAVPKHAEGGWNPARPGGSLYRAGEAGHDEVTLTTDPRHAPRQQRLLSEYLRRAPHMASGGYVYPIPGFTLGRTDMGVDANAAPGTPIGAIGDSKLVSVISNWFQGQPLLDFQLLSGPDAGRFWYVAEQIIPVTEAIGAMFRAGQMVARYAPHGTGIEMGWAANASGQTLAQGTTGYSEGQVTSAGSSFRNFIGGLAHGQIVSGALTGLQQIVAPKISGVYGALGSIAQSSVNMATSAANQFLGQFGGAAAPASGGLSGSIKTMVGQLSSRFGWGGPQEQDWLNVIGAESGGNPNAVNPSSGAFGIGQFLGSTLQEYAKYGATSHSAAAQLYAMAMYIRDRYRNPASAWAHEQAYHWYAAGGLLGRHLRRMGLRHLRRQVLRFADGGRAPWGGEPVPIVAHEGERISNPMQWGEVARLAGTTPEGLDHHLGFDTGRPRQHFQDGGTLRPGQGYSTFPKTSSFSSIVSFLGSLTSNLFTLDPGSIFGAFTALSHLLQSMTSALGDINRLPIKSQVDKLSTLIEAFADPNNPDSTLNLLSAAFQRFQNNIGSWVTSLGYHTTNVAATSIARMVDGHFQGTGLGGVALAGPGLTAGNIGQTGQARLDALGVRGSAEQTQFLRRQGEAVQKALTGVRHRMNVIRHSNLSAKTKKSSLSTLQGLYTELVQQQENLNNAINSQIATTFQNETQYIQDTLNQINDVYQTHQQGIQTRQSTAQALGQYGKLPGLDQSLIESAKAQIQALQKPLHEAQRTHNADLVAQIKQQISQLQQTIGQTTAQMIQDSISGVQQTAQTQQARVSMLQTIAQTMQGAAGSPGQIAAAFGVNAQALQLNQTSLQQQVSAYNSLLGQALATGNQGAVATLTQTIDQLTAQLAQNEQAIQDNTAQMVAQEAQFTQARGQFQTGTLGGLAQIITTIGQTTGFTDVASLRALVRGQNSVLGGTQSTLLGQLAQLGGGASGLASLLGGASSPAAFVAALSGANLSGIEAGQSSTWINTFETLINNLTQNTQAIAQNNQQLAQLNGMLLQPQQWSTSMWTNFRNAIFSGMGNLLPQYQSTLSGSAVPTIAPIFGSPTTGRVAPTVGTLNINHAPTSTFSPSVLGEQMAFELANAL